MRGLTEFEIIEVSGGGPLTQAQLRQLEAVLVYWGAGLTLAGAVAAVVPGGQFAGASIALVGVLSSALGFAAGKASDLSASTLDPAGQSASGKIRQWLDDSTPTVAP